MSEKPSPELKDAWNRLLRLDCLVQELKGTTQYEDIQKIAHRMEKALRGFADELPS